VESREKLHPGGLKNFLFSSKVKKKTKVTMARLNEMLDSKGRFNEDLAGAESSPSGVEGRDRGK